MPPDSPEVPDWLTALKESQQKKARRGNFRSALSLWVRQGVRKPLRRLRRHLRMFFAVRLFPWMHPARFAEARARAASIGAIAPGDFAVSLLIPSRARPDWLKQVLENIRDTAGQPELVEIIVRLDDDDKASLAVREELPTHCAPCQLQLLVGPRGRGYIDMHHFFNEMAEVARGDFLWTFNDDWRFTTTNWVEKVLPHRQHPVVLCPPTDPITWARDGRPGNLCPAPHRKLVELAGLYSPTTHIDTWWQDVSRWLPAPPAEAILQGVQIRHLKGEIEDEAWLISQQNFKTSAKRYYSGAMHRRLYRTIWTLTLWRRSHPLQN